ncbi:MAG: C10 family peptidase, partial [Bacteroidota bacterium]
MKKIVLTFVLATFSMLLFASPVNKKDAELIAINYYKHRASSAITDYSVSRVIENQYQGTLTYYVFIFNAGGFVMVSADDAAVPILGYSLENNFLENNRPPNMEEWYNNYDKQIKYIVDNKIDNKEMIQEWYSIRDNNFTRNIQAVPALLSTTWGQGCNYNTSCPADAAGSCGHCKTGCIATAMAQIMKYWNYPTKGTGSNSYTQSPYGTLSADFGATTYNWGSMPNNVTSSNTAVATLMYHCGVGCNMKYGPNSSAGKFAKTLIAFVNYFNYPYAECKDMSKFTVSSWISMLKTELNASRPVFY